jgi:hypothetical protein
MIGPTDRDVHPPVVASPEPPWELWLGYDLEQYYEFFAEIHFVAADAFPDEVIAQLDVVRDWMVFQLRQLRVPDLLIGAAEQAAVEVRRWTDVSVFADKALNRRRQSIRDTFELLMHLTCAHVSADRRRYYDFGVMIRRVSACVVMDRQVPDLPSWAHEGWPGLAGTYRRELRRSCATLVSFVRDDGPDNRPDPALHLLDTDFRTLADHLASWLETEDPPDLRFLGLLQAASYRAGLLTSAKNALGGPRSGGPPS